MRSGPWWVRSAGWCLLALVGGLVLFFVLVGFVFWAGIGGETSGVDVFIVLVVMVVSVAASIIGVRLAVRAFRTRPRDWSEVPEDSAHAEYSDPERPVLPVVALTPPKGVKARVAPDQRLIPIARIPGGVSVLIIEHTYGGWARVKIEGDDNEWWVPANRLRGI